MHGVIPAFNKRDPQVGHFPAFDPLFQRHTNRARNLVLVFC